MVYVNTLNIANAPGAADAYDFEPGSHLANELDGSIITGITFARSGDCYIVEGLYVAKEKKIKNATFYNPLINNVSNIAIEPMSDGGTMVSAVLANGVDHRVFVQRSTV